MPNPGMKDRTMKKVWANAQNAQRSRPQRSSGGRSSPPGAIANAPAVRAKAKDINKTPGAHFVRGATGGKTIWYVYAWRGGPLAFRIEGCTRPVLTPRQAAILNARANEHRAGIERPREQNLGWLIRQWRSSPEWEAFSPTTRRTWGGALGLIERKWGKQPVMRFYDEATIPELIAWRDARRKTPRAADTGIAAMRALLKYGRFRVGAAINIAAGIPALYRNGSRAEIIWLDHEIARFVEAANAMAMPDVADAIRLAAVSGLRRSDLVTVSKLHLRPAAIFKKAEKKSGGRQRQITIPRVHALEALLDELSKRFRRPGVDTILVDRFGKAWHPERLTRDFGRVRDAVGVVHIDECTGLARKKHLHDLRGTFVTKLIMETGLSDVEIARIMGWSPAEVETIRMFYVDQDAYASALSQRIPSHAFPVIPMAP
jgi:integrase